MLVVGPLKGGGGIPPEPLKKQTFFSFFIEKKIPEPYETQEKLIKKILEVMFSASQYRWTEKCYEIFNRKNFVLKSNLTEFY